MYVHLNVVAGLSDYCCNVNAVTYSHPVVVDLQAAVNNIKLLSGAMETEQSVIFPLFVDLQNIRTAVNNTNVLVRSCAVPDPAFRL
jgi:hypothetical protein